MKRLSTFYYAAILLMVFSQCTPPSKNEISLAGEWDVKLDSLNIGHNEDWAENKFEGTKIQLPGTLDDAEIGIKNTLEPAMNNYVLSHLTRKHQYIGAAWYQREIDIPNNWIDQQISLELERVLWESQVYVDGKKIGSQESLSASHQYDLTKLLTPGKHLLTIRIDNSNKYPKINREGAMYPDIVSRDMTHAYTNHTQIKWNGIIGNIVLKTSEPRTPKNIQIYPNVQSNTLRIAFEQVKPNPDDFEYEIVAENNKVIYKSSIEQATIENNMVNFEIKTPEGVTLWDEFDPKLYDFNLLYKNGRKKDTVGTRFGYRQIEHKNGDLILNGRRIFLRGNLECAIFPLTGYPPMEKEDWAKLINQAKNYGLNHLRFHSWCPPKAAFDAADEAGFYLQVELPHWSLVVGEDENTTEFLRAEGDRMLREYGNSPSFIMMALGNELEGDADLMNSMVKDLRKKDNRRLYATTAMSFQKPMGLRPEVEDDYFITQWTEKGWVRGQGIFNSQSPNFDKDYSENCDFIEVPLISHEIGQYSVYPSMTEIAKYTGVLEPLNFIAIKNELEKKGLLDLADDFTHASGKLATILYKEEIERALKTPSFDGFQLLQLQDFPGQGTALVGLLDAFWDSKGVVSAEEFRQFNSEVVPLLRFEKAVYETGETYKASIEVANFFKKMAGQIIEWTIKDDNGNELKKGKLNAVDLTIGNNTELGNIEFPINTDYAKKLTVNVSLQGTEYRNSWSIWIYPKNKQIVPKDVVITSSMEKAFLALEQGNKVLLNPPPKTLKGIEGRFVPVFWSPVHFPNQPASMGLLLDDEHPAFNSFPTSSHTDWQWWDLCINSTSVITDSINVTPLVRVIDNFVTNRHMANVFEAKVGKGKLVFSSIDLFSNLDKRPVARQFKKSLLDYMQSNDFAPLNTVKIEELKMLKSDGEQGAFSDKDIYQ